jgi:hypothetical protein
MKISYRLTSGAALGALALPMVSAFLPSPPPRHLPMPVGTGEVGFDLCHVWVQLDPMCKLLVWVWFGAYVVFAVQGLRNRSGPRWLAIAGLPALFLWIQSDWWRISAGCYSTGSVILMFVWAGTVSLMFLHHAIARPANQDSGSPGSPAPARRFALARGAVLPALTFMPIAWNTLSLFRTFRDEQDRLQGAIAAVQLCISWTTVALAMIAAALLAVRLYNQQPKKLPQQETRSASPDI